MHLSLSALVPLALLVSSVSAGLVPKSPRSSLNGNAQLRREIQRRQVTTADLKRRKNQPKRKRADPSQPVCVPSPVGQNLLINGDFETGSFAPWTVSKTGDGAQLNPAGSFGYRAEGVSDVGSIFVASASGGTGHLEQTVQLCAGTYDVSFMVGHTQYGDRDCPVQVAITFDGTTTTLYSGTPCVTEACSLYNGIDEHYSRQQRTFGPLASAGPATITWDATCSAGSTNANYADFDNISIARAA